MKLMVHSNVSYLSEPQAYSRAGGQFLLSNKATIPTNNGAVLNIAHIIKHVMTSATEAKLAALYHGTRSSVYHNSNRRNGPQTTIIITTNRWHHCGGCVQQQNTTQTNQSNGHEISLVKGQTVPRTIQKYLK